MNQDEFRKIPENHEIIADFLILLKKIYFLAN